MQSDALNLPAEKTRGPGTVVRLAYAAWVITLLFEAGMIGFGFANGELNDPWGIITLIAATLAFQSMATIGVLIVRSDPRSAEGWLFCAAPLLMMCGNFFGAYAEYALNTNPGSLPGGIAAAVLGVTWLMGATLFVSFLILLFPDGRLPSRRWRPVGWIGGFALVSLWVGLVFSPGHLDSPLQRFENPLGVEGLRVLVLGALLVPALLVAGIVAAVLRYVRGSVIERQQLRLFVAAVCVSAIAVVVALVSPIATGHDVPDFVMLLCMWLVPLAVGTSILRYRLYEIDVIVRKTLIYAALAATLAMIYLGGVLLTGWALRSVAGQSSTVAVTLSTLVVAAAFQPLRTRIQRAVDHRFYRGNYDATRALEAFNGRLRNHIDLDALCGEVVGVATETLQPSHIGLWLREYEN